MPYRARALLCALAFPSLLAAQQQFTVRGDRVAIYNLAGAATLDAGSGPDVVVAVTRGGADAARLTIEQGRLGNRETLRVVYPATTIVYPGLERGSRTELTVKAEGTFDDYDDRSGSRVRIVGSGNGLDARADLRVSVPQGRSVALYVGVGRVTATNVDGTLKVVVASGDVQVNGGRGDLVLDTGAGNVGVKGTNGALTIDTGSGNVTLSSVTATTLAVDTGSGDVGGSEVVAERLGVDAGSGRISLTGSRLGTAEIESGSGDIRLELAADPGDLDVETGSGDVVLRLPASTGAQLAIETASGDIVTEFPVQVTRTGSDELRGTIGDGRGRITVESGSGSVRLQKL